MNGYVPWKNYSERLPEHADNMSIASIFIVSPLVLLNEDLTVIAASQSFCLAFDVDCGQQ